MWLPVICLFPPEDFILLKKSVEERLVQYYEIKRIPNQQFTVAMFSAPHSGAQYLLHVICHIVPESAG